MTSRGLARRIGRRRSRALGIVLFVYGAGGLILLLTIGLSIVPMLSTIETLAHSSAEVRATLTATRSAFDGFDSSLADAQRSAQHAAAAAQSSAVTARQLASAMSLSVFGAQPLLPLASGFSRQGQDLDALASDLGSLATSLEQNQFDVRGVRLQVDAVHARATALPSDPGGAAWIVPALALLLLWLAVPAVGSAAAGVYLLRLSR